MPAPNDSTDRGTDSEFHELARKQSNARGSASPFQSLVSWLTEYGERAGNALIYSSAYMAVIAMASVSITMVLLSLPPNPAPLVVGLVAFAVYANDRLIDVDADAVTDPERTAFVRRHRSTLSVLASISFGLAVAISTVGGPEALGLTLLPGAFWVLYATNLVPRIGLSIRRLKELLLVNSVVVAFAWATSVTFLPIVFVDAPITPTVFVVFGYFFVGIFVNTEIPNVYDKSGDEEIGVATLPVVIGVSRTRQVLYALNILTAILVVYAVHGGLLSAILAVLLLLGIVYSLGVTAFLGRSNNGQLVTLAAEFVHVFVGLLFAPVVYMT